MARKKEKKEKGIIDQLLVYSTEPTERRTEGSRFHY
jgi:hypothetical protein